MPRSPRPRCLRRSPPGRPELAVLGLPAAAVVLCRARCGRERRPDVSVALALDTNRAIEGDRITIEVRASSASGAPWLEVALDASARVVADGERDRRAVRARGRRRSRCR